MSSVGIAAGFAIAFGVILVILVIAIFSDSELSFPGSDSLDVSIRQTLGRWTLLSATIAIAIMLFLVTGAEQIRYWVGTFSCAVATYVLVAGVRVMLRAPKPLSVETTDAIAKEMADIENALILERKRRIVRLGALLGSIVFAVVMADYSYVSKSLSRFDVISVILVLVSLEWLFFSHVIEKKKRLTAMRS
jgi:hypothetical protein